MAKLTQEEIDQIKKLQQFYNQTVFDLGKIEAQLASLDRKLNTIQQEKEKVLQDLKLIEDKETQLSQDLQGKYGQGNINIETGEITPIQ
jgi:septal ring factor EnvC (AmiA/AmiB activator)